MKRLAIPMALVLALGCAPPVTTALRPSKFRHEDPGSILIVPVVNHSLDVAAPGLLLSTFPVPLAEKGYYVFPTYLVKRVLEDDGLADATLVHEADPRRLGELFGADAILYVTINQWTAKYALLLTSVEVDVTYVIKSGRTGEELWRSHQALQEAQQAGNSGNPAADLVASLVVAAVSKAAPNFMPVARRANAMAFYGPHRGLPAGPHSEAHGKDPDVW